MHSTSFSYDQINMLRQLARELMRGGMSRAELAQEMDVSPSQIANFVREYGATKRPKSEGFLLPLHELAIRQSPEKIINPAVRSICKEYRETLPPEMLFANSENPVDDVTKYVIIESGQGTEEETQLTITTSEKLTKAEMEMTTIANTSVVLTGVAVLGNLSITALLSDPKSRRTVSLQLARTDLPGSYSGLIIKNNLAGQISARRVVAFEVDELLDSVGPTNELARSELAQTIFQQGAELDVADLIA